jgi:regulator of sigma D
MLTRLEKAQAQYGGANKIIDAWLEERQEWLVRYCQLAGLPPFERSQKNTMPEQDEVHRFCQIMMDYVSAGHFEIYDKVIADCESKNEESLSLAQSLTPKISQLTDYTLTFNDKFTDKKNRSQLEDFNEDLSKLGQVMEERFALEDQLIHTLYTKHTETV